MKPNLHSVAVGFAACALLLANCTQAEVNLPTAPLPWSLDWPQRNLRSDFAEIQTVESLPASDWHWQAREASAGELAGTPGRIVVDRYRSGGLSLRREVWTPTDGSDQTACAIRYRLQNDSGTNLHLRAISPLRLRGAGALQLAGADAGDWEMLYQGIQMNYFPTTLRLGTYDTEYQLATDYSKDLEPRSRIDGKPVAVHSEPLSLLRRAGRDDSLLLVGYLEQKDHLTEVVVRTDDQRAHLAALTAVDHFDEVLLPPGVARASNWLLLLAGSEPNALLGDYAQRIARLYHLPRQPRPAPAVFCTWGYFGPELDENLLAESVAALAASGVPTDVYQIDDSWMPHPHRWGDWTADPHRWSRGLADAAARIRREGWQAGLWLAPFLGAEFSPIVREHPELLLRDRAGQPILFRRIDTNAIYCLDPTAPGFTNFLHATFTRLHADGFNYFKLDFLRAAFVYPQARFHDPTATRLQAYERGVAAIRAAVGPDAFINICNGHYGGSLGLADGFRTGSDTLVKWNGGRLVQPRQSIFRTWMQPWWIPDPDVIGVRRQPVEGAPFGELSIGTLTEAETHTMLLRQYLVGGAATFADPMERLDPDRLALYRHFVPALGTPARILDFFAPGVPTVFVTAVKPRCPNLAPWLTLAAVNWSDQTITRSLTLAARVIGPSPASRYLAWDFFQQRALGLYAPGDRLDFGPIEPHSSRLIRLAPWDGKQPTLAGTDAHYSGGGVELARWRVTTNGTIQGELTAAQRQPLAIYIARPDSAAPGFQITTQQIPAGTRSFTSPAR